MVPWWLWQVMTRPASASADLRALALRRSRTRVSTPATLPACDIKTWAAFPAPHIVTMIGILLEAHSVA